MNIKDLYVAVEVQDNHGAINDTGTVEDSPENAWAAVADVFHAPDTIICKLVQYGTVEDVRKTVPDYKVIKINP